MERKCKYNYDIRTSDVLIILEDNLEELIEGGYIDDITENLTDKQYENIMTILADDFKKSEIWDKVNEYAKNYMRQRLNKFNKEV